jgi:hypothetical protein
MIVVRQLVPVSCRPRISFLNAFHHLISASRHRVNPMCAFARTLLRLLGRVPIALVLLAASAQR